jgi:glutamate synthase domain-containing protein 1
VEKAGFSSVWTVSDRFAPGAERPVDLAAMNVPYPLTERPALPHHAVELQVWPFGRMADVDGAATGSHSVALAAQAVAVRRRPAIRSFGIVFPVPKYSC